jgi:UDP-N-acetylmuramyl-tripeptide synthetase
MKCLSVYGEKLINAGLVTEIFIEKDQRKTVRGLTFDSKEAVKNGIFVCKGANFRVEYLKEALEGGCICYVAEKTYALPVNCSYIIVRDIRKAMPVLAALFYHTEQMPLKVSGITGTKGKTTTAYYLKAILDTWSVQKGESATGLLSSVDTYDGKTVKPAQMTTPEALEIHRHMRACADAGLEYLTMEVSSQALKYQRVRGMEFEVGIFLNISEDHISPNEHEDFRDYFSAKLSIFKQTKTACINLDSDHREEILKAAHLSQRVVTFGTTGSPDVWGHDIEMQKGRISFRVKTETFHEKFSLRMHGLFNVENALAAVAAAYAYGVPVECMKKALAEVQVKGRMEEFESRDKKLVAIVDYAHNRLSFEKLYDSVYKEYPGYRIVTVFGCPGEKALNRRRDLGLVSGLFSQLVYLTTDDPANESVTKISREVSHYIEMVGCACCCVEDREEAIRKAILEAEERTVILVLGKGSEGRQRFGNQTCLCPTDSEMVEACMMEYDRKMMFRKAAHE